MEQESGTLWSAAVECSKLQRNQAPKAPTGLPLCRAKLLFACLFTVRFTNAWGHYSGNGITHGQQIRVNLEPRRR